MHFQPTYLLVKPNNSYYFLHPTSCHCKKAYPQVPKKWEVLIAFFVFGGGGGGGVGEWGMLKIFEILIR